MFVGYAKAFVPIMRETFKFKDDIPMMYQTCSKEENLEKVEDCLLSEKTAFGIVTCKNIGHIPSLRISFPDDNFNLLRDNYVFKSLEIDGKNNKLSVHINPVESLRKQFSYDISSTDAS